MFAREGFLVATAMLLRIMGLKGALTRPVADLGEAVLSLRRHRTSSMGDRLPAAGLASVLRLEFWTARELRAFQKQSHESAGMNRLGVAAERAAQERSSDPP